MYCKSTLIALLASLVSPVAHAQNYQRMTNLPHVIIETENHASITSKDTYIYATLYYVDENDQVTTYEGMQIRGRGNSTWNLPKKPYRIKFSQKEKFLGTGYAKAKSWTLLANASDKTLMHNAITSLMGDFLGLKNNPAHKFVDLTLNGTYVGNYQISDQVEVRPHRVNIAEQDYPLTEESDITGGYLLEVDGFKDGNLITTSHYGLPVVIHYPDDEEIVPEQTNYIHEYLNEFERVLSGNDFADPEKGYRAWVDSTSLVNWFIATEVSGNVDGYWSTYFYKEQQDPKLYWGPLWDYDIAYNNDNRTDRNGTDNTERQLMTDAGYGATKLWINRMWQDPWFGQLVNRRYAQVVQEGLEEYLYQQIDSIANLLQESQQLNFQQWGISTRVLRERVLYSSYDQYLDYLKNYIGVHMAYLRTAFAEKKVAEPTPLFVADNCYYTITNSNTGRAIATTNKTGLAGAPVSTWSVSASDESQQWRIIPVDGYFMLINRQSGMALNDPTPGSSTATTNTGTQLDTAEPDAEDDRQLWSLTPQGIAGYYNLTNLYTHHTANLSGGINADGAAILSYTTDSRNSTSKNRLWFITSGEKIEEDTPEVPDAIASVEPDEYALAYNPQTKTLHFGSETPEYLTFTVWVYTSNGVLKRSFRASEECSLADLPHGVYIIAWTTGGKTRSTKLLVQ